MMTAAERSPGSSRGFGQGYLLYFMDAVFVNEAGIERSQVQDEAFLELFKDKRQREMRLIQSCRRRTVWF